MNENSEIKIDLEVPNVISKLSIVQQNDKFISEIEGIIYRTYPGEHMINQIIELMTQELSEPYPIFTYRYFLNEFPEACIIAYDSEQNNKFVGCILGNCEIKKKSKKKGYIAMIAVERPYRGRRIGKYLCELFINQMKNIFQADEIYLETEITNSMALSLYEGFGFVRTKRLLNYYLNGNSAFRLKKWLKLEETTD